jgi:hypothetical protein
VRAVCSAGVEVVTGSSFPDWQEEINTRREESINEKFLIGLWFSTIK